MNATATNGLPPVPTRRRRTRKSYPVTVSYRAPRPVTPTRKTLLVGTATYRAR